MPLKLYNTLSGKKEIFKPRLGKKVNIFVCGITPYDFSHIGHARTYVVFDMIVRYLRQKGYKVFYLQNVTDVDDKIIAKAKEKRKPWLELSRGFEKEYRKNMADLKINSVSEYARATLHIKEITSQVIRLLKKGYAYKARDGIYFDISKFQNYGKLSKRTVLQAQDAVSKIDEAVGKKNKGDFCLWKLAPYRTEGSGAGFSKPKEPEWPSPWGQGRPGWHIEDTAITEKYFGPQYDIHGGARDLIFPHHEAEIAQMEAISEKKPLAKYWLHSGFLTVKGQKMSKSLRNFITIKDFLKKYPARVLRLIVLKTHYRSPIDYNEKLIQQSKADSDRIAEFVGKIQDIISSKKESAEPTEDLASKTKKDFEKALEDDFNTPEALSSIFKFISRGNSLISENKIGANYAKKIYELFKELDKIMGIELTRIHYQINIKENLKLKELMQVREKYRQKNDWQKADQIRQKILQMGYKVEDTEQGAKLKKL